MKFKKNSLLFIVLCSSQLALSYPPPFELSNRKPQQQEMSENASTNQLHKKKNFDCNDCLSCKKKMCERFWKLDEVVFAGLAMVFLGGCNYLYESCNDNTHLE
ncbi:MAG: hypothetical protein AB7R69_04790 [Candidatus Babeliales bacterium]